MLGLGFHAGAVCGSESVNLDAQFDDLLAGIADLVLQIHRRDEFTFPGSFPGSDNGASREFVLRDYSDEGLRQPSLREQVHRHAAHTRTDTGNDFPNRLRVCDALLVGKTRGHFQTEGCIEIRSPQG